MSATTVRDLLTAATRELADRSGSSLAASAAVALQLTTAELAELTRAGRGEPRRPIGELLHAAADKHPQREEFSRAKMLDLLKDLTPAELEGHALAVEEAPAPSEASDEAPAPSEGETSPVIAKE